MKILNIKYATYKCSKVNFNVVKLNIRNYLFNNQGSQFLDSSILFTNIQNISITIDKEIILNKNLNFDLLKTNATIEIDDSINLNNVNIKNISITISKEIILNTNLDFSLLKTNSAVSHATQTRELGMLDVNLGFNLFNILIDQNISVTTPSDPYSGIGITLEIGTLV